MTGSSYEREIVNRLTDHGFAVMRAPSSGSSTTRDLPDLTACRACSDVLTVDAGLPTPNDSDRATPASGPSTTMWAIEAKANSQRHIYVDDAEILALNRFANAGGYTAFIAARWKRDQSFGWNSTAWYLIRPDQCYVTDGGAYRVTRPDAKNDTDRTLADAQGQWPGPVITDREILGPD